MKTLLLIDNQDITREGMKTVAGRIGGFAAIKEAGSQSELTGLQCIVQCRCSVGLYIV